MRRTVLTLERPGWEDARKRVDAMLAGGYTYADILRTVNERGKAPGKLNLSTLQRYQQARYARQKSIFDAARMQADAAMEVLQRHGTPEAGEMVRMQLVQAFLANIHKLADADPIKVGWLQVQYEHVAQQQKQLEQAKRELELKLETLQQAQQKARKNIDKTLDSARTLDDETKRKIREEVYGITA